MIGKYERGEAVPSIDAAKKIADALEVSLDHLVGGGLHYGLDKKTLKRLPEFEQLDEVKRRHYTIWLIHTSERLKPKGGCVKEKAR